jgi:hypothetical protein
MFRPLNYDEGKVQFIPATNAQTFVKGDAVVYTSGYAVEAADGEGGTVHFVAAETRTPAADGELLAVWPTAGVWFEADTDAAWSVVDQGTWADLATEATVDPDASTDDIFFIVKGVGTAETDTKVIGFFNPGLES